MKGIYCAVTLLVLLVVETSGDLRRQTSERRTHGESSEDAWSVCQALAVSSKLCGNALPLETSIFSEDPIPGGPTGYRNIDDAELLPKEVRLADLVGVALEIFGPFV